MDKFGATLYENEQGAKFWSVNNEEKDYSINIIGPISSAELNLIINKLNTKDQ